MTTIELIYDHDCPNVPKARAQLMRVFAQTGLPASWLEWQRDDPASPDYVHSYGSPTILVDGKDVEGVAPSAGISCCRLYADPSGQAQGVPSVQMISSALRASGLLGALSNRPMRNAGWRSSLAAVPGIGIAILPMIACPACWPAYAGLLIALGLGFLMDTVYLLPLTAIFLTFAVGMLAFRAKARKGYGPFLTGLIASGIIIVGKFVFVSDAAMYGGVALLVVASVWNAWPRKAARTVNHACPACASGGQVSSSQESGAKELP